MKRDRVVGILGTAVLFFVFFLALSRVATMLADNAFPLGIGMARQSPLSSR